MQDNRLFAPGCLIILMFISTGISGHLLPEPSRFWVGLLVFTAIPTIFALWYRSSVKKARAELCKMADQQETDTTAESGPETVEESTPPLLGGLPLEQSVLLYWNARLWSVRFYMVHRRPRFFF